MILIDRADEPSGWRQMQMDEIKRVWCSLAAGTPLKDIEFGKKYAEEKKLMWATQHYKCGWCEVKEQLSYHDVEHYRPKKAALGSDGEMREGWWWLAWTWENLFFTCPNCNRSAKRSSFPLRDEDKRLLPCQQPPGPEKPLLLDPCDSKLPPLHHLQFRLVLQGWWVLPRGGSRRGAKTIEILDLNRDELRVLYADHVKNNLDDVIIDLKKRLFAAKNGPANQQSFCDAWSQQATRLTRPSQVFSALNHDVLDHHFPPTLRKKWELTLPHP